MSNIGHYVLGDEVYGRKNKNFQVIFIHCFLNKCVIKPLTDLAKIIKIKKDE